jgi:FtsP/CotA-like multicopper oxidase with cupredoxin domain
MGPIDRRDFLQISGLGMATLVLGCSGGGGGGSTGGTPNPGGGTPDPVDTLRFTITDAFKEMVTYEPNAPLQEPVGSAPELNPAICYLWIFKEDRFAAECPGPQIFAIEGDRVTLIVKNELTGPHAFYIPGMVDTGPIAPGDTWTGEFTAKDAGTYLYYDNLNEPVNRVMGLHGALVVMPKAAASGHQLTPYKNPTSGVQALYDDFGSKPWWPGLAWNAGDAATQTPPTRQHIWLTHQASPVLFAEVGQYAKDQAALGLDPEYPPAQFLEAFINDPFKNTSNDARTAAGAGPLAKTPTFNRKPCFFTINGQSGHFCHNHPTITPMHRVGEPTLIRILNAGLWTHSMHMHANHFFITAVNNVVQENPIWVDVFTVHPMDHVDYTIPYMRPPDVPNARGIGRAETVDTLVSPQSGKPTWPPSEEFQVYQPALGTFAPSFLPPHTPVDMAQRQSPLCYPMHDHSEPSQVAMGGNYNCGLISGIYFIGDRNTVMTFMPGRPHDFPIDADFQMMLDGGGSTTATGPSAGSPIG